MKRKTACCAACLLLVITSVPASRASDEAAATSSDPLLREARAVLQRQAPDKTTEKRLEQIVLTLSGQSPTPASREMIESLARRPPQIFVPHEEGDMTIPFVDVGAAARFTLRHWQRKAAFRKTLDAIQTGDPFLPANYLAAAAPVQDGMIDAILASNAEQAVRYRDASLFNFSMPGGDRLAAAVGGVLADEAVLQRVILDGTPPVALDTVSRLATITDAETTLRIMQESLARSDIASAALFEIGRLSRTLPAAESLIWELLADRELGGSAAAVLARLADRNTVNRLIDRLQHSEPGFAQKRLVLALRLSGDAVAMRIADRWTDQWSDNNAVRDR